MTILISSSRFEHDFLLAIFGLLKEREDFEIPLLPVIVCYILVPSKTGPFARFSPEIVQI